MTSNIVCIIPLTMTVVSSGDRYRMCSRGRQASDINLPLEGTRTHKYCAEWAFTFDDLPAISLGAVSAVRRKVGPFVFQGA